MKQENPTPEEFVETVKQQLSSYIELRIDLFKAHFTEKLAKVSGKLISVMLMLFVLFFSVLFLSLVLGIYLGKLTDSMLAGFGIVALFYVVLFVILLFFRKQLIESQVANLIISIIYESDED